MKICINCRQGFHKSCRKPCPCTHEEVIAIGGSDDRGEERTISVTNDEDDSDNRQRRTRRLKRDDALKDQQSTGRKRAARQYPFIGADGQSQSQGKEDRAPCEWRGFKNCGGGDSPIKGCANGVQQARHHGPDKSVSNNDEGNVHRICHRCHNKWHASNNPNYDWNRTLFPPHRPEPMTDEEKFWAAVEDEGKKFKPIKD